MTLGLERARRPSQSCFSGRIFDAQARKRRQAARQVTGATLRELLAPVDRSLLQRTSAGRYDVHELLRQYAAEKLAQAPDAGEGVRDRHCAHYVTGGSREHLR